MGKSLIIALSGKKRSGKNTAANFIAASFLKRSRDIVDFKINKLGLIEARKNNHYFTVEENEFNKIFEDTDIKLYSFADYLKQFCMNIFSLTNNQVYGEEKEKNSLTNIKLYDLIDMSLSLLYKFTNDEKFIKCNILDNNEYLTSRQILQIFGTEICRKIDPNCWVNGTISIIKKDNKKIAIIMDCRFPNEIEAINTIGGKTIRLLRSVAGKDEHVSETVLDNYPRDKFNLIIDNRNMSVDEQCAFLEPHIEKWLNEFHGK